MAVNSIMEILERRRSLSRRCSMITALAVGLVVASACGSPSVDSPGAPAGLSGEFVRQFQSAQAEGIDVYWLGIRLSSAGFTYSISSVTYEPDLYGFGRELSIEYVAESPDGRLLLPISLQGRDDWESWSSERAAALASYTERAVPVGPWSGVLYIKPGLLRDRQQARLVVDTGRTVVTALASPTIKVGGQQINPFSSNPDLLVQPIGENLRPYPQ